MLHDDDERCVAYGAWWLADCVWCMVYGVWCMVDDV